MGLSHVFT